MTKTYKTAREIKVGDKVLVADRIVETVREVHWDQPDFVVQTELGIYYLDPEEKVSIAP